VDSFEQLPIHRIVELFTAVGFSSPPSWLKPYEVLSGGERFRCDLARALGNGFRLSAVGCQQEVLSGRKPKAESREPLVVFDEFTSVVDRTVAKVCSAAVGKGIRRGSIPCRFVAVTCHYDVADWLEPDWVVDMSTCELYRRCLLWGNPLWRRPRIELEIHRCEVGAWELFRRHHYLSGEVPLGSRCYLTTWEGAPMNFCAVAALVGRRNHRRFARIVTLPDFQGIGIGMRAVAAIAELHRAEGHRINITSSHPAMVRHCSRSPLWRLVGVRRYEGRGRSKAFPQYRAHGRTVVSFEYVGEKKVSGVRSGVGEKWRIGNREAV
jgi:GNAT superfamily N-acetyltransferase